MPTLDRISCAEIGGSMTAAGRHLNAVHAAAVRDDRALPVPPTVLRMLQKANITPPPPNLKYEVGELDSALIAGGLTIEERLQCKNVLSLHKLL